MKNIGEMKMSKPKPTLSVDATDLPAIKDWEVGKTYEVKAKVKMTFQSQGDEWSSPSGGTDKTMRARFTVVDITPEKEMPKDKKVGKKISRRYK